MKFLVVLSIFLSANLALGDSTSEKEQVIDQVRQVLRETPEWQAWEQAKRTLDQAVDQALNPAERDLDQAKQALDQAEQALDQAWHTLEPQVLQVLVRRTPEWQVFDQAYQALRETPEWLDFTQAKQDLDQSRHTLEPQVPQVLQALRETPEWQVPEWQVFDQADQ